MKTPISKIKSPNTLFFVFGMIFTWYCLANMASDTQRNPLIVTKSIGKFQLQPFFFDNKLIIKRDDVIDVEIMFDNYSTAKKYIFYNFSGQPIVTIERVNQDDWVSMVNDIDGNKLEDIDFDGIFDIKSSNGDKYIFVNSEWLKVEKIEKFRALVNNKEYEFTKELGWKLKK